MGLAGEAVRKSPAQLKNGNSPNQQFLPLPKKATGRILVAGTHANNLVDGGQWKYHNWYVHFSFIFFCSWWIHAILDSIYIHYDPL
jgi:hypothetical protein